LSLGKQLAKLGPLTFAFAQLRVELSNLLLEQPHYEPVHFNVTVFCVPS
jgi:hypothetical protein